MLLRLSYLVTALVLPHIHTKRKMLLSALFHVDVGDIDDLEVYRYLHFCLHVFEISKRSKPQLRYL